MPKVEKKRSAAKTTPCKKLAQAVSKLVTSGSMVRMPCSASPTPPPSPGAEQRAQDAWIQTKQADLQKKIGKMEASVLAAQQTMAAGFDAESLLAYDELRHLGVDNVFHTVEQPIFDDSSSEDSDTESESEKSTEH